MGQGAKGSTAQRRRSTLPRGARGRGRSRLGPGLALLAALLAGTTLVLAPARPAAALHPVLDATWAPVATTGGGYVTGVAASPTLGSPYARTDIGGAYRWDATTQRWLPMLDQQAGLGDPAYGVDGLAVDHADPQHVWAAVGRVRGPATAPSGAHAVMRSTNGGVTWTDTGFANASAVINGNMEGRWTGERIAVDPFDDDRAFLATRGDGLWVYDEGAWSKHPDLPDGGGVVPGSANREGFAVNPIGVSFVALHPQPLAADPSRPRVVYAAVWGEGVYRSQNGGVTFTKLAGSPEHLTQGMVSRRDNVFYGVGASTDGAATAVWRLEGDGSWTDEKPCGAAGCGSRDLVALDIDNAGNVVAAVRSTVVASHPIYHCAYASSTSCVGRWTQIQGATTQPGWRAGASFTGTRATSSLRFAPHAAGTAATSLLVGDFFGVSAGTRSGSTWTWADRTAGIEITASTDLAAGTTSAGSPRLYSGALDVSGFRHDSFGTTPTESFPTQGDAAQGGNQDTTGIDVSSAATGRVVYRVGLGTNGHARPGGWSTDQGASWTPFANSSPAAYGGRVAVAADDEDRLVWVPEVVDRPRASTNRGAGWSVLSAPNTVRSARFDTDNNSPLAASQVANGNPADDDFFLYDPSMGFHRATTSGSTTSFTSVANGLPTGDTQGWPSMRFGVATDPVRPGVVVAGVCGSTAANRGFWFSSNRGTTFTKRTGISCAQAVAVGAPLPGGGTSAIYVIGQEPGGPSGQVFISTDDGVTWDRLDRTGLLTTTPLTNLEADPVAPGRIYMSSKGRGVFTGQADVGSSPSSAPATPGAPTVTEGSDSVTLSWGAPANGGSPITSYRVTVTGADGSVIGTRTFASTATTQTITTLDGGAPRIADGGTYRFRVAATNAVGTGVASAASGIGIPPHRGSGGATNVARLLAVTQGGFPGVAWTGAETAQRTTQLGTGAATTPSIVIGRRDEADGRAVLMWDPLIRLYRASFLRQPDTSGFAFWMDERLAGQTMDTVANRFSTTLEFRNRYDALDDEAFVEQVYQNVLDRSADAAGLAYWTEQLETRTRGWVIYRFSISVEYVDRSRAVVEACSLQWGMTGTMPTNARMADLVAETGSYPSYDASGRAGMVRVVMGDAAYVSRFP